MIKGVNGEVKISRKDGALIITAILCIILGAALVISNLDFTVKPERSGSFAELGFTIHGTIEFYKDGVLLYRFHHPGSVCNLGLNLTMTKLSGYNPAYNITTYTMNTTFVSIGDQGTLNDASTELPGEWNRTTATVVYHAFDRFNVSGTIYPDAGPYTADCFGVNYQAGISNNALFCYDTFVQVTGIDDTFTIIINFEISAT
jgi:hypothetical protein